MLVGSCLQCRGASAISFVNIDDILRHGRVARLDPGVPAHNVLHLMVDTSDILVIKIILVIVIVSFFNNHFSYYLVIVADSNELRN